MLGIRIRRRGPVTIAVLALMVLSLPSPRSWASPPRRPAQKPVPPAAPALEALLAKAAEYCRKLESSAFDFVCREEIRESIDPKLDVTIVRSSRTRPPDARTEGLEGGRYIGPIISIGRSWSRIKNSYVYDYQCVRAGRTIRETRTQLEENGKRKNVPNAELQTSVVVFGTALLAPVGLFGERFQPDYDFTVVAEEKIGKTRALVVNAEPKPGAPPSRNLFGKAWIDAATGDILKIEWSDSRVGNFDIFEKRGELYKRTPRLTIRSEFSAEKSGIRFPSRLHVEEAYLKGSSKVFIRSKTDVVYKDFKFFTVTYEVRD
jgi:hypothetical protein